MTSTRCCSPLTDEERQELSKWSEDIQNLLENEDGREKYKRYLALKGLEEDLNCVTFWEMSVDLQLLADEIKQDEEQTISPRDPTLRGKFNVLTNSLLSYALDKVNFDLQQLKELGKLTNHPEDCLKILPRARASSGVILKNTYEDFIRRLLAYRLPGTDQFD